MARLVAVEQSQVLNADPGKAFAAALDIPLPALLPRRYGPFPPIESVQGQTRWVQAGDSRTIVPAGGGSMRETLTDVDGPRSFGYAITEIAGPMALLVDRIDGLWTFSPQGGGTRVSWRWTLHAKSMLTLPVVRVLGWLWPGYARLALNSLAGYLA
ncbi:MAG: SRPBCC family protein [Mycobacterium sp.]|nr:SRPBCC family protein [Mycobacterium sp.]